MNSDMKTAPPALAPSRVQSRMQSRAGSERAPSVESSLTKSPELLDAPWTKAGEISAAEIALNAWNDYLVFNASQVKLLASANTWALTLVCIPVLIGGVTSLSALVNSDNAIFIGLVVSSVGNTINAISAGYSRSKDFHGRQERYSTYAKECKNFANQIKTILSAYGRNHRPPFSKCMTEWMKRWGELTTHKPEFARECEKNFTSLQIEKISDFITIFQCDDNDMDMVLDDETAGRNELRDRLKVVSHHWDETIRENHPTSPHA